MSLGLRLEGGPFQWKAPKGPPEYTKYVAQNDTDCLIRGKSLNGKVDIIVIILECIHCLAESGWELSFSSTFAN